MPRCLLKKINRVACKVRRRSCLFISGWRHSTGTIVLLGDMFKHPNSFLSSKMMGNKNTIWRIVLISIITLADRNNPWSVFTLIHIQASPGLCQFTRWFYIIQNDYTILREKVYITNTENKRKTFSEQSDCPETCYWLRGNFQRNLPETGQCFQNIKQNIII